MTSITFTPHSLSSSTTLSLPFTLTKPTSSSSSSSFFLAIIPPRRPSLSSPPSVCFVMGASDYLVYSCLLGGNLVSFTTIKPCLLQNAEKELTATMDNVSGPSIYPLRRCKIIHLVRHAQGVHNIEGEKNHEAYMKPEYLDAPLSPLGWQQVDNLRRHVHDSGLYKGIELVITSPMLRTMQTAVGIFGGEGYTDRMDVLPLMVANAGNSNRSPISSLNCPPIMAVELCRERLGVHPCDKRRSVHEYECLFPAIDFTQIESDEDILWKADVRETKAEVAARGIKFMNWLLTRKEKEIAVVTHSGILLDTLTQFGNECHPLMKDDMSQRFKNCELRSMVLVDKNMAGTDAHSADYPGKIPDGPDIPSYVADENNPPSV